MQQSKEAAAEAEAQGDGTLHFVAHGGVVELQLFQSIPQVLILGAVGGIDAGEHHGLYRPVAGQRLLGRILHSGDGVAYLGVGHGFDGGGDVAHFAGPQGIPGTQTVRTHGAHFHHLVFRSGGHHFDVHAGLHRALLYPGVDDDATIRVVLAVKNQGLEGAVPVPRRSRHVPDDHFQHGMNVNAVFGRDFRGLLGGDADDVLNFRLHLCRTGGGQVNFVDDRQHFQTGVNGQVGVCQRLGLYTLGGVHHQHCPFAGGQGTGDFVVEVHMARRVDQVQGVDFPVVGGIVQCNSGGFDGDAPLPLQLHGVQQLFGPGPLIDGVTLFQQPVGQGGLAVVNVGDNGKIADVLQICHMGCTSLGNGSAAGLSKSPPAEGQTYTFSQL